MKWFSLVFKNAKLEIKKFIIFASRFMLENYRWFHNLYRDENVRLNFFKLHSSKALHEKKNQQKLVLKFLEINLVYSTIP